MRDVPLRYIQMTSGQLIPPDSKIEDAAFGISAHHMALERFATYLRLKLWVFPTKMAYDEAPVIYAGAARGFERAALTVALAAKSLGQKVLQLFGRPRKAVVSLAEPDKVHTNSAPARTNAAKFLMQSKVKALKTLRKDFKAEAEHPTALDTVSAITNRPFASHQHAREWLDKFGR